MRKTKYFSIADNVIVSFDNTLCSLLDEAWSSFAREDCAKADIVIDRSVLHNIDSSIATMSVEPFAHLYECGKLMFLANQTYDHAMIIGNTMHNVKYVAEKASGILNLVTYSYCSVRKMVLMHASLISFEGKGILFIGPSGIGKTTQAERWAEYCGADIINGDLVYVSHRDDGFYGCGTPWHGSSTYCLNRQVPLVAIVALEQAGHNSLERKTEEDRLPYILRNAYLPSWYSDGLDCVCNTLTELFDNVPLYLLKNKADEEGVLLLKKTVIG